MIGEPFVYHGRRGQVRATYPGPDGMCVVGVYDDARPIGDESVCDDSTHYVGRWCECVAMLGAAA